MNTHTRILTAALMVVCFALTLPAASARDHEFGLLVHHLESYYHARHQHGFVLGFASLAVKMVRPYGVKNFKLALFENQDFSSSRNDLGFAQVVRAGLGQGWRPLVEVYSRRNDERTYIFARDLGKDFKLLIATVERNEAVVMQVKLDAEKLDRSINGWVHQPHRAPIR